MGINEPKAPSSRGLMLAGKRGKIFGNCYLPGGDGPYPVVLLLHGIPGIEKLLDFSIGLREAGFAVSGVVESPIVGKRAGNVEYLVRAVFGTAPAV